MTDDLVERIRNCGWNNMDEWDAVMRAAADRIEALERVIDDALGHLEADEPAEAAVILQTRRHHALEAK